MTRDVLRNVRRNMGRRWFKWYMSLPKFKDGDVVRCPANRQIVNQDGSPGTEPIPEEELPGCGSANVSFSDCYDCHDCGIFFSDYAADPPHRRWK